MPVPDHAATLRRFGRLLHAIAGLTLLLVLVGVIVRSTGSGLGCGTAGGWHDWPLCHGQLLPPATLDSILEFSHRAFAALVSLFLLGGAIWTAVTPVLRRTVGGALLATVGLLVLQIVLGALTVRMLDDDAINPGFVVVHLITAFTFFCTLVVLGLHALELSKHATEGAGVPPAAPSPQAAASLLQRIFFLVTFSATFFQIILGGLVANLGASMACPEFPTCAGGVLIPTLSGDIGLQIVHRIGAVAVSALIFALPFVLGGDTGSLRRMSRVAIGLVLAQFALGVATVLLGLPLMARALHHVVAYALLGTLAGIGYKIFASPQRETRVAEVETGATFATR
ncbi:MAG: COX15/CtaA family protein [Candidatus Sericytochromatia bacterium]|uniref:COX15/CtaA family protein n=1 Tax=Candidatus Tanganyikabacteria bacterium TaxID=2961651 RepID=A0A937X1N1_9BACT|nr:COX15/CtaA family protein [Candidatus Tanganyikabacteria bacterium]